MYSYIASLASVALGCFIAARAGVPASVWSRNLVAWICGAMLFALFIRTRPVPVALLLITPAALLATFLGPSQHGVHRWIAVGPLVWNVASLFLPATIVALARTRAHWPWIIALAITAILYRQPDASQATAFAAAIILLLFRTPFPPLPRAALVLAFLTLAAITWTRPDPLQPVPHVEGILPLAWQESPALAVLGTLTLAATVTAARSLPLAIYYAAAILATAFGAFPVPWLGMGMSPILGYCLAASLIRATQHADVNRSSSTPLAVKTPVQ